MLGHRIAALRRDRGISQAQLAQRLGVSASAIGMYEQGRREPAAQLLVALARELEVSTDYLLTGRSADRGEQQAMAALLERRLTRVQQRLREREGPSLSSQELTALLAAMLLEP